MKPAAPNVQAFLDKFYQFADAPDAVTKLRHLILSLAIRGRLVPQDIDDEPAETILAATRAYFAQLLAAKDISVPKSLPPISDKDTPFPLPRGWTWCRLGNLLRVSSGDGLTAKDMNTGTIPVYGGNGINGYHDRHNVTKPTIVIGRVGFYCGSIHVTPERAWVTDNAFVTTYDEKSMSREFLRWLLQATDLRERDNATAQPVISGTKVYPIVLGIPPLAEQKRIVAKVDELMALCDRLEAQLQERDTRQAALARAALARFADAPTPANLELLFHDSFTITPADLRKTILTLAVQGHLVPQNPDDEPAEQLLAAIAKNVAADPKSRLANADAAEPGNEGPYELPSGWAWSKFPQLGEFGRGKSKHRPRNDPALFIDGTHKLVQTGDVARSNGTIRTHTALYNDTGLSQSRMWPTGTLCITIAANIADSGILTFDACFPDSVVGFIPSRPIPSARYFEYFVRTAKERLEEFAPATAQKNINLGILEQVWIPIPPLSEQRRIVAKVDQLMALVDQWESQLAAAHTTADHLLSALVAELTAHN